MENDDPENDDPDIVRSLRWLFKDTENLMALEAFALLALGAAAYCSRLFQVLRGFSQDELAGLELPEVLGLVNTVIASDSDLSRSAF
jgi:hypothetical protein